MFSFYHIFSFLIVASIAITTVAFIKLFGIEKKYHFTFLGIKFYWTWPGAEYGLTVIILALSFFLFKLVFFLLTQFKGFFLPVVLLLISVAYISLYLKKNDKK